MVDWETIYYISFSTGALVVIAGVIHSFLAADRRERHKIREYYTTLVKEKLEVLKTALAMGRDASEIAELDRRLERLIGNEEMLNTLREPTAKAEAEIEQLSSKLNVDELESLTEQPRKELEG